MVMKFMYLVKSTYDNSHTIYTYSIPLLCLEFTKNLNKNGKWIPADLKILSNLSLQRSVVVFFIIVFVILLGLSFVL